jgi:hypothetical protein
MPEKPLAGAIKKRPENFPYFSSMIRPPTLNCSFLTFYTELEAVPVVYRKRAGGTIKPGRVPWAPSSNYLSRREADPGNPWGKDPGASDNFVKGREPRPGPGPYGA